MGINYMSSNDLITSVKRRASIPENQSTFTESDFLELANEEMAIGIVPDIMDLHEDYFLFQEDQPLQTNTSDYTIPARAVGNKLRELAFKDQNGNIFEMTRISVGDLSDFQGTYTQNHAYTYYVLNNKIVVVPPVQDNVSGSLLFTYYIRPNALVSESRVGTITAINKTTGEITVDNVPDHFNTTIKLDMIQIRSPHRSLSIDKTATSINSTTKVLTFDTDDIPADLVVGDHIAQAEETIVPQIPSDLHVVLAHRVALRILESIGDFQGLQVAVSKLQEMEHKTGTLIDDRVDDSPKKIVNRNGLLRFGLHSKRFRRRN